MKRLAAKGVGTRPFFWPMHQQPVFEKRSLMVAEHLPHAERLARRGLSHARPAERTHGLAGPHRGVTRRGETRRLAPDRVTDAQQVAVGVAQRELARAPGRRGDRLGDRGVLLAAQRVGEVGVVDEHADRGGARQQVVGACGASVLARNSSIPRARTAPKLSPRVHAISSPSTSRYQACDTATSATGS